MRRMNGDWLITSGDEPLDRFTRAFIELTDRTRIELHDSRALSALTLHGKGVDPLPSLGMEANDPALTAAHLKQALARRRTAIKPALMDQKVIAGLGNIYAAEALWRAGPHTSVPNARNRDSSQQPGSELRSF